MRKLTLDMYFEKKENFDEDTFIEIIKKDLKGLWVSEFLYNPMDGFYRFHITYKNMIPEIDYRSILGVFSSLIYEYPYIKNVSIPLSKMTLENVKI